MSSNNVLLLDAHKVFKAEANISGKAHIFKTSADAVITLKSKPKIRWAEVYLDYDLGVKRDGQIDTAMPLVSYICEQAELGTPVNIDIVYVTCVDDEKALMIEHALRYYGYTVERNDASHLLISTDA
jgi:hypothetical protein